MLLLADKRIFIVEDNPQNRVVFQMALVRHGAQVDFDRWGRDAVAHLIDASQLNLIVLDLMLAEGVSGFDLYDEIRAVPKLAAIPVVAVSAMDAAVALPMARSKGFAGFIAKPIDNNLFPKQIATILTGQPVWHTGERTIS